MIPEVPRWRTLARRDPEFDSLLDGSFSEEYRALPQRSLNVGTATELVTFEIKPVSEIGVPSVTSVAWVLARPRSLGLSMGPMVAVLAFCLARGLDVNYAIAFSSFCGVLLFHIAVNLFNDYGDHVRGRDRLSPHGGSRVIQRGWLRAFWVRRWAWGLLVLSALFGLPAVLLHRGGPLWIIAGVASLIALEFAFQQFRLKAHGWAEIMAFLLTGPLLAAGFAWAATGTVTWAEVALGCIYGSISLMYFHSANFENIMADSQSGVRTWATRAGFDASKVFFHFTTGLAFACMIGFIALFDREVILVPVVLALGASLMGASLRVHRLASPLSSELTGLREVAITQAWLVTLGLAGAYCVLAFQG